MSWDPFGLGLGDPWVQYPYATLSRGARVSSEISLNLLASGGGITTHNSRIIETELFPDHPAGVGYVNFSAGTDFTGFMGGYLDLVLAHLLAIAPAWVTSVDAHWVQITINPGGLEGEINGTLPVLDDYTWAYDLRHVTGGALIDPSLGWVAVPGAPGVHSALYPEDWSDSNDLSANGDGVPGGGAAFLVRPGTPHTWPGQDAGNDANATVWTPEEVADTALTISVAAHASRFCLISDLGFIVQFRYVGAASTIDVGDGPSGMRVLDA